MKPEAAAFGLRFKAEATGGESRQWKFNSD